MVTLAALKFRNFRMSEFQDLNVRHRKSCHPGGDLLGYDLRYTTGLGGVHACNAMGVVVRNAAL